jgi:hypothetical protein
MAEFSTLHESTEQNRESVPSSEEGKEIVTELISLPT